MATGEPKNGQCDRGESSRPSASADALTPNATPFRASGDTRVQGKRDGLAAAMRGASCSVDGPPPETDSAVRRRIVVGILSGLLVVVVVIGLVMWLAADISL